MSGRDVADECWPGRNIEAEAVDMTNPSSRRKRTMVELALSCCTVHKLAVRPVRLHTPHRRGGPSHEG